MVSSSAAVASDFPGHAAMSPAPTSTAPTVTAVAPLLPSLVAVIVALPGLSALTRPVASTSAAVGAVLAHVTDRLRTGVPLAIGVAVSCSVAPTNAPGAVGLTVTALTGGRS